MRTSRTRQSLPPPHDSGSISDDTSETASDTRSDVESDVTDPIDYEWTGEHQLPEGLPVPPRIYFNGFGKIGSVAFGPIIHSDVPNPFGLERYRIPTSESLQRFAAGEFPEACFISFLLQYLVVELPRVSDREHVLRCSFLPRAIGLARIMITYANGPLVHKRQLYDPKAGERVRFEHTQDAKGKESIRDTTHSTSTGLRMDEEDYIEATNHFYPGSMMRSEEGVNFSASVPLVRGKEMGMPISLGCWQNRYNQGLHIAGNHTETFRIHHGNTLVCDKIERYNDSTVALAKIVKPALFKPKFFSVSIFAEIDPI
ncbi:MAG: hypothetical protein M1814_006658 [Vezdaea aestivalis]|nr:MAG: hypothetical protein M1814_006658 [Vezdaea aestivalis]